MKINTIGKTNDNLNFGVNYINKNKWNKDVLSTLKKSKLVSDIDNKYPNADICYVKINLTGLDIGNDEPDYLASLIFKLAKDKISTFSMNSHSSEGADNALLKFINSINLGVVESNSKNEVVSQRHSVEIVSKPASFTKKITDSLKSIVNIFK